MQSYPVRPGQIAKVDFGMVFDACFDSHAKDGDWYTGSYGSMPTIRARYEGKQLVVDTVTDKSILPLVAKGDREAMRMAMETQQRWNEFLESVTGYDAKERKKKAEEEAKKASKAQAEKDAEEARSRLAAKLAAQRAKNGQAAPAKTATKAAPAKDAAKAGSSKASANVAPTKKASKGSSK